MVWVVNTTPWPLYPRERRGTHFIGGWVGPRPVSTGVENLPPTGIRSPDRPARSESLYRLSSPGPCDSSRQKPTFRRNLLHVFSRISTLNMEAVTSLIRVPVHQSARCHIPQASSAHIQSCWNVKPNFVVTRIHKHHR
jgi:hypothetical protein